MKSIKNIIAVIALATVSFGSFAATEVSQDQGQNAGVVSARAMTLNDLQSELAAKADAAGAKSFRIISAGGENMVYGTAEIYK